MGAAFAASSGARTLFVAVRTVLLLTLAAGCRHSPPAPSAEPAPGREDRNVLTQAQLLNQSFASVYEAISALRSNWLVPRGVDSFQSPSEVVVYMNSTRLGGVDYLRQFSVNTVVLIQHYDAVTATARWGVGHSQGVIQLLTY